MSQAATAFVAEARVSELPQGQPLLLRRGSRAARRQQLGRQVRQAKGSASRTQVADAEADVASIVA